MRLLRILLGAAVIAGLTAIGACWIAGQQFEQAVTRSIAKHQHPDLQVQLLDYQRGPFRAQAETLWHYQSEGQTLEWRVSHQIQHGPLPAGKLARVHSQLDSHALPVDLRLLFADASPLQADSVIYLNGAHHHQLRSPVASAQREDETLHWGGLDGQLRVHAGQQQLQAYLTAPTLRITDLSDGELSLEGLALEIAAEYQRGHRLWSGPTTLTLQNLRLREGGETFALHGLGLSTEMTQQDALLQLRHHWTLDGLQLLDETIHDLVVELELGRLETTAFSQLLQGKGTPGARQGHGGLLQQLQTLLGHQPYLAIHQLQARHPQGMIGMTGRLEYLGQGNLLAMNPAKELRAEASLEAPASLLKELLAQQQRESMLELAKLLDWDADAEEFQILMEQTIRVQLNQLLQQGYFIEQDGRWYSEARFEQGRLHINGRAADALVGELLGMLLR